MINIVQQILPEIAGICSNCTSLIYYTEYRIENNGKNLAQFPQFMWNYVELCHRRYRH